jgi:ABC-type Mn2+/Zn2+ transport system ATPase subunit
VAATVHSHPPAPASRAVSSERGAAVATGGAGGLRPARLELCNVTVSYDGRPALLDVSFSVPHGAQWAVVGPNGSGKSTLFKALVGLLPLRAGRVLIHEEPLGLEKECVAYVPQREEVDWRFPVTVRDVVMMGRFGRQGWFRRAGAEDRRVVALSLEQMGIAELAGEPIGELSGGQQQRVFLARALAQEPHVLLMDEPFTGVDVATQEAVLGVLETLRAREVTVMVSTHDLNLAATRFDGVVLLNTRLVAAGTPAQVFTPAMVAQAFGGQVLLLDGALVVDRCCPPDDPEGGR